jgi:hypothetical protein
MGKRDWVKSAGKKLPEDMGDWPTLPQEMLDLLTNLRAEKSHGVWSRARSNANERRSIPAWRGQAEKTVQRAIAQGRDAHLDARL